MCVVVMSITAETLRISWGGTVEKLRVRLFQYRCTDDPADPYEGLDNSIVEFHQSRQSKDGRMMADSWNHKPQLECHLLLMTYDER